MYNDWGVRCSTATKLFIKNNNIFVSYPYK